MTTIQIKKDGQDPQVINVPEGAKIIIEDGVTIVDPWFKKGDFIFDTESGSVQIYSGSEFVIAQLFLDSKSLYLSGSSEVKLSNARHATESEKQLLIDILAKDGKQWNPDTKQIEDLKYIPKAGDCVEYWFDYSPLKKGYSVLTVEGKFIYKKGTFIGCLSGEVKSNIYDNISECLFRKITPEELQSKFNELGYEYNFETHTAEKLRWYPKAGEAYYYPTLWNKNLYSESTNIGVELDKICIANKFAFKTPEEAIKIAKRWLQQL